MESKEERLQRLKRWKQMIRPQLAEALAMLPSRDGRTTSQRRIAAQFGISQRNVFDIIHNHIWKHLPKTN